MVGGRKYLKLDANTLASKEARSRVTFYVHKCANKY
jgi:hypothetical protein